MIPYIRGGKDQLERCIVPVKAQAAVEEQPKPAARGMTRLAQTKPACEQKYAAGET